MIYFVRAIGDRLIKIGFTEGAVSDRLSSLKVGSSAPLEVLATLDGGVKVEKSLHAFFAADRKRGEWFSPSPRLIRLVAGLMRPYGPFPFGWYASHEPQLWPLAVECGMAETQDGEGADAAAFWYGYGRFEGRGVKMRLCPLVGFDRERIADLTDRHLTTPQAYDLTYDVLVRLIPGGAAYQQIAGFLETA